MIAEGPNGRAYVAPTKFQQDVAFTSKATWRPEQLQPENPRWFSPPAYGMQTFGDLFTERQLAALNTFSDLVDEARQKVEVDALASGMKDDGLPLRNDGIGAKAYAEALSVYFAFLIDQMANNNSSICTWHSSNTQLRSVLRVKRYR